MDLFQTHSQRLLENNTFTCTPHSPLNYTIVPLQASSNSRTYSVLQLDARMTNHFNESTTMVPVSNIRDTAIKGGTLSSSPAHTLLMTEASRCQTTFSSSYHS